MSAQWQHRGAGARRPIPWRQRVRRSLSREADLGREMSAWPSNGNARRSALLSSRCVAKEWRVRETDCHRTAQVLRRPARRAGASRAPARPGNRCGSRAPAACRVFDSDDRAPSPKGTIRPCRFAPHPQQPRFQVDLIELQPCQPETRSPCVKAGSSASRASAQTDPADPGADLLVDTGDGFRARRVENPVVRSMRPPPGERVPARARGRTGRGRQTAFEQPREVPRTTPTSVQRAARFRAAR
jgi:hypothetical protein